MDRNWILPGEISAGSRLVGSTVSGCGHENHPAVWADEMGSGLDRLGHFVDGTEGDAVEGAGEEFSAGGVNLGVESERADDFIEKGSFLNLRLGEGDFDLRVKD